MANKSFYQFYQNRILLETNLDDLDFEFNITAPGATDFEIFEGNKKILTGEALGMAKSGSRSAKKSLVTFWIKVPGLGISDFTQTDKLDSPFAKIIHDRLMELWSFPDKRFAMQYDR
jgi:hypothetical protein